MRPSLILRWRLGQGAVKHDLSPKKTWDLDKTPPRDVYRLLTSAIIPRPIAFVSSISPSGTRNLAPFSYFSMVSQNPPLLSISTTIPKNRPKDTRQNILDTKEFTVNIVSSAFVEAANACSVEAPEWVDEWVVSGLTPENSRLVKPACVKESAVSMECQLHFYHDIYALNDPNRITNTLILGLIKQVHVRESVLNPDGQTISPTLLDPVARLGGNSYAKISEGDVFDIERTSWVENKEEISKMHQKK